MDWFLLFRNQSHTQKRTKLKHNDKDREKTFGRMRINQRILRHAAAGGQVCHRKPASRRDKADHRRDHREKEKTTTANIVRMHTLREFKDYKQSRPLAEKEKHFIKTFGV